MTPDDYEKAHAASFRDQKIAEVYREYQKRLQSNNALDFDDLIFKTIFLFKRIQMCLPSTRHGLSTLWWTSIRIRTIHSLYW